MIVFQSDHSKVFHRYNISILIIPSHISHAIQMFDVVLGYPLKNYFSDKFEKLINLVNMSLLTNASKIRYVVIKTIVLV